MIAASVVSRRADSCRANSRSLDTVVHIHPPLDCEESLECEYVAPVQQGVRGEVEWPKYVNIASQSGDH